MISRIILISILLISCETSNKKTYVPVIVDSDWFEISYIKSKTYIIAEPHSSQGNVSYLILGDKKAIMFDTGCGENETVNGTKIKHVINQITDLPVTLILSHLHFDHNQNITEFDHIAFPDIDGFKDRLDKDGYYNFTSSDLFIGDYPNRVYVDEWIELGKDYDLGNRKIQLIHMSGHTDESVIIIDQDNELTFLGDVAYNGALYLFDNDDIIQYKSSINRLELMTGSSYRFFGGHGKPEIIFSDIIRFKSFFECIDNKTCTYQSTNLWGYDVHLYEHDGQNVVIFQK